MILASIFSSNLPLSGEKSRIHSDNRRCDRNALECSSNNTTFYHKRKYVNQRFRPRLRTVKNEVPPFRLDYQCTVLYRPYIGITVLSVYYSSRERSVSCYVDNVIHCRRLENTRALVTIFITVEDHVNRFLGYVNDAFYFEVVHRGM